MHKSTVSFGVSGGDTKGKISCHGGISKQPRDHIQQWGGWYVVNHGVDHRDNIGVCGHPLRINGVDHRDKVGWYS